MLGTIGFLTALLVAFAIAAFAIAGFLHRTEQLIADAVEDVRAAEELEAALFEYDHLGNLGLATGADETVPLDALEKRVQRSIEEERLFADTAAEAELFREIDARAQAYLAARARILASRPEVKEAIALSQPYLDALLIPLKDLANLNMAQAHAAQDRAAGWDRLAGALSVGVALLAVVAAVLAMIIVQRGVYRPLESVRAALGRFASGIRTARAQVAGPAEVRAIAQVFNDMADRLAQQEEDQLGFLGGVAHDLRDPLAALRLSVSRADARGGALSPADGAHMVQVVKRQVGQLERMVADFLDTARIQAGKLELSLARCDLRAVARDAVTVFRRASPGQTIEVTTPSAPVIVRCDAARITHMLNNLVGLVIKSSARGGPIAITVDAVGDEAEIQIIDSGAGAVPEDLARVFTRARGKGQPSGAAPGLGLWVARQIVEAHGGAVDVDREEGLGFLFRVRLPLVGARARPEEAATG